jgi:hypothetical protein
LWIFTTFAGLFTIASVLARVEDTRGGDATATVVHVYTQEAYSITFVTKDGRRCLTDHKWDPRKDTVHVSDTFQVHYSQFSPCDNVRRADDRSFWSGFLIAPTMFAVGAVGLLLARWSRPKDTRYHGPPRF